MCWFDVQCSSVYGSVDFGICTKLVDKLDLEHLITHHRSLLIKEYDLVVRKNYDLHKKNLFTI
jgi:hypothetical protein